MDALNHTKNVCAVIDCQLDSTNKASWMLLHATVTHS